MKNINFNADSTKRVIKSLDNFLYNIANNVLCTICQELFIKAVTNQCGHSFCTKCIKKFHATSKYGKANCPLCRHPIKNRSGIENPVLSKLAEICSEAPEALREDVMKLTQNFGYVPEDLIKSARISGICEEKVKDDEARKKDSQKLKKAVKVNAQKGNSNGSLALCSVVNNDEEIVDLKSVSQMGSKSESCIADSSEMEKKLRNIRIVTTEKVNNWLQNVNNSIISTPESILSENDGEYEFPVRPNKGKVISSGMSMIRIDYGKPKKADGPRNDTTPSLVENNDPYEFISSQMNTMSKRKKISRRRKRVQPQFERIHCFAKNKLRKDNDENNAAAFSDDDSVRVQKPIRTYSTRSSRNKVINETNHPSTYKEDILIRKHVKQGRSDNEGSCVADDISEYKSDVAISKNKSRARRRILPSHSDSCDSFDSSCLSKLKSDDDGKDETVRKPRASKKNSQSPGWSRVTNLKIDFETADKRYRPCRKTLDISGGDLNVKATKMKSSAEISSESDKKVQVSNDHDVSINNMNQKPDLTDQNTEKIQFKVVEENRGNETKGIPCNEVPVKIRTELKTVTEVTTIPSDETTRRTINRNIIPFSLLGRIKKKRNISIIFLKMGRLSPFLAKSGKTIVKFVFPSITRRKTSVNIQTAESVIETGIASVKHVLSKASSEVKVDVGVQATGDASTSKEVQTSQRDNSNSIAIQTDMSMSSLIFEGFDKRRDEEKSRNEDPENELNKELQSELNKTWAATETEVFGCSARGENYGKIVEPGANNELIHGVIDNVNLNLNLITVRDVQKQPTPVKSAKLADICEESDSDIFIEQTPPRKMPLEAKDCPAEELVENVDESFLILSECRSNIPESVKNVENDESSQREPHRESRDSSKDRKLCIVSSGIRNRKMIEKFVKIFKVEHSNFPKKEMTHLVVGLHENEDDEFVPYCTPKFLYAIANKKWIVTESWIEECLKSKRIVGEEPFESVDPVGGNGCNIARLSTSFLLYNWQIYLYGKFVTITKEEFAELIKDCGGTIVSHLKDFSYTESKIRMILLDGSALEEEKQEYEGLSKRYRTLVMSRDVAIMSIQSYQMVNFTPFVQHQFSTDECVKWGYPLYLVKKDINMDDSNSDGLTQS